MKKKTNVLESLGIFGTKMGQTFNVDVEGVQYLVECVSENPLILIVENFVSSEESEHIKIRSMNRLEKSFVMGGGNEGYENVAPHSTGITEQRSPSPTDTTSTEIDPALYRSSYNAWLPQDSILDTLQLRLSKILGIPSAYLKQKSEQLQVVRYTPGGQFKVHQDSSAFNTRLFTALLYLNTPSVSYNSDGGSDTATSVTSVDGGGETWFPYAGDGIAVPTQEFSVEDAVKAALQEYESSRIGSSTQKASLPGLKVSPVLGKAVIFFNHLKSGTIDPMAVHAGLPIYPLNHQLRSISALGEYDTQVDSINGSSTSTGVVRINVNGDAIEKWVANYWVEYDPTALAEHIP